MSQFTRMITKLQKPKKEDKVKEKEPQHQGRLDDKLKGQMVDKYTKKGK